MPTHDPIVGLLLLYPAVYASAFAHEVGHAVTGRLVGFTVTSFGMGAARPVWHVRVAGVRVYLALGRPFAGLTWSFLPELFPPRGKLVAFASGGILANVLVCALALVLWTSLSWGSAVWATVAAVNGLLAGISAIPFQMRVGKAPMRTDGALIVQALRSATFAAPAPLVIQSERYFRGLWSAIGDDLMRIVHRLGAAEAWASLGDYERAAELLAEGGDARGPLPAIVQAHAHLVRGELASGQYRFAEADQELAEAESWYCAADQDLGPPVVAVARVQSRLLRNEVAGAAAELEPLLPRVRASGRAELEAAALVPCVGIAAALGDREALERWARRYDGVRRAQPSAVRDLYVYQTLAHFHVARGEWDAAGRHFDRAIAAAADLAAAWLDPAERERFVERCAPLVEGAQQCLGALGRPDDVDRLLTTLDARPEDALGARDKKLRGVARRALCLNVLAIAVTAVLAKLIGFTSLAGRHCALVSGMLAVLSALAGLYALFDWAIGRRVPALRGSGGAILLILASFPWAFVVALTAIILAFAPG